jgi:hypothetical protein
MSLSHAMCCLSHRCSSSLVTYMSMIFVLFALPLLSPGDRHFLAAHSSREAE